MRVGSLIKLRPEYEERYIILHKHVFQGVLARIRKSQIRNYSIYLRDGMLFSYYEYSGDNFERDMAQIGEDEETREWWKLTDPMQEPLASRKEGEWWASMDEAFHWDKQEAVSERTRRMAFFTGLAGRSEDEAVESLKIAYPILVEKADLKDVQSFSVYHKDGRLYSYFEFSDVDSNSDLQKLQESLKVEDELDWMPMREVFHTD